MKKSIAIVGGGPAGLFMFKKLIESKNLEITVDIFESKKQLGLGMPYSHDGANTEHVTNVSGNEIPELVTPLSEWINTLSPEKLKKFNLDPEEFHDYKVLPRLLFGEYLAAQFHMLLEKAQKINVVTCVHLDSTVTNITDIAKQQKVRIEIAGKDVMEFDRVIICTGHKWPLTYEGNVAGYFDSPYPPAKLEKIFNHPVAIRGSSLTAIDAIRTLARHNGSFKQEGPHELSYHPNKDASDFKIIMHSRHGLLPGIRFHLEDPHLSKASLLTQKEIEEHISSNEGFLSLDFIFDKDFKEPFRKQDPSFYEMVKDMSIEEFVEKMMGMREKAEPFEFFLKEYEEAKKSIRRKESVYWKEMLAILSFAMNYPAKHLSAEDMQRLQRVLIPLISIVIAFVPQSSCEEMIALHSAGKLEITSVGDNSHIEIKESGGIIYHLSDEDGNTIEKAYQTFVDCIGQRHLLFTDFPFKGLLENGSISEATLAFKSTDEGKKAMEKDKKLIGKKENNKYFLKVPGIKITDTFKAVGEDGNANPRIYVMAVPYIGGYNPDYSGLDFCEEASGIIVKDMA